MKAAGARVLVVDDSAYTRQILRRVLEADPLVGSVEAAGNGQVALQKALRTPPDLVTLDLQMPVMDGFTFLRLFRARSAAPVLVVSALADLLNVDKALDLGASGFLSKPEDPYRNLEAIAEELHLKLRQHLGSPRGPAPAEPQPDRSRRGAAPDFPVVVIGCSSGGPATLQYLLSGLPRVPRAAVLIAQHMPVGFTASFAQRLDALLPAAVREGAEGEVVRPGEVVIAPGGCHMVVRGSGSEVTLGVVPAGDDAHAPSVDRLFETAAQVYGPRLTAVILTGMGRDGAQGVRRVKAAGGEVLAESEATAAIYGMPKQAAATGCVDRLLPLPELAVRLMCLWGEGGDPEPAPPVSPGRGAERGLRVEG